SLFIVKAANPMLIRSMNAIMKRTKTNGMMCVRSLWIVVASIAVGAGAGAEAIPHLGLLLRGSVALTSVGSESVVKSRHCYGIITFRTRRDLPAKGYSILVT